MAMTYMQDEPGVQTIYIPPHHNEQDLTVIHDLMEEFNFACMVTTQPSLRATHIPLLLDRKEGKMGRILGHVSRNNPHKGAFDGTKEALAIFHGPHQYISPSWYQTKNAVPTWNFAVVHAAGKPTLVDDKQVFETFLRRLIAKSEAYDNTGWNLDKIPAGYKDGMLGGAVMFEMPIDHIEAKFKLGGERPEADKQGMLTGLRKTKPQRSVADYMEASYKRAAKK